MNGKNQDNYTKRNYNNKNTRDNRETRDERNPNPNRPKNPTNVKNFDNEFDWKHDKFGSFKQPYQAPAQQPPTNNQRYHKNSRNSDFYQENMNWAHDKFNDLEREFNTQKKYRKKRSQNDHNREEVEYYKEPSHSNRDQYIQTKNQQGNYEKEPNYNNTMSNQMKNSNNNADEYAIRNNTKKGNTAKKQLVDIYITSEDGYTTDISVNLADENNLEHMIKCLLSDKGQSDFEYNETTLAIYSTILDNFTDHYTYPLNDIQELHEKAVKNYVNACFIKSKG